MALAGAAPAVAAEGGPRIAIFSPRTLQVVQRGADGSADIRVRGRASGFDGAVQARWGRRGAWTTVNPNRRGKFIVKLPAQPAGQADLTVRSALYPEIFATRAQVGVGDIYVVAGQSNASGRSPTLLTCADPSLTAMVFGNDYRWHALADPVDSPVGQIDVVSRDDAAGGSVWPLVAQDLMAAERAPVAFVPCARIGAGIRGWRRPASGAGAAYRLYGSMLRRIRAVGGRVRAVLFWQGEADAKRLTPGALYEERLLQLGRDLRRDCGAPLMVAQIGDYGPAFLDAGVDAIRLAQQRAWGRANVVAGPALYDIDLEGVVHFAAADDMEVAAHRWTAAILAGVSGRSAARSPVLSAVAWDDAREVTVTVAPGTGRLASGPAGGFTVSAAGVPVAIESASVDTGGVVRLRLAETPASPPTVALGSGRSGAGAQVPVESSGWRLPMLPFAAQPVVPPL